MDSLDETIDRVAAGFDIEDAFIGPDDGPSSRSSSPSMEDRNVNITQPVPLIYQCSPCLKQFLTKHGIESHQRKFHSSQPNELILTSNTTHSVQNSPVSSLSSLKNIPAQLICEACEMKFLLWPKLVEHMRQFHRDSYECCGLIFATLVGLDIHKATHNNGQVSESPAATAAPKSLSSSTPVIGNLTRGLDSKRFKCYICKIEFRFRNTLKFHLQGVHEKTLADNQAIFEKEKEDCSVSCSELRSFPGNRGFRNVSISKTVFLCSECVIVFYTKEELNEHKHSHHPNFSPPDFCPPNFSPPNFSPRVCISTPKVTAENRVSDFQKRKQKFLPENCPASVSIAEHTIVHESESLLENTIKSTNKLQKAVKKKHKCPSCYKLFSSSLALTLHSNRIHHVPADVTFPCRICKQQFYTNFERNRHSKVHNKTIVYQCFICSTKYRWISDLQKHLRIIHGKTFTHGQDMEQTGVDNLPKSSRLEKFRMNSQVQKFHSSDSKSMDTNDDFTPSIVSVSGSNNGMEDSRNNKNAEPVDFVPIIISVTGSSIVAFKEHEEIHLDSGESEKNGVTVTSEEGLQAEVYDKNKSAESLGTEAQDRRVMAEDGPDPDGNSVLNDRDRDPLLTEIDLVSEPESEHEEDSPAKDTSSSREVLVPSTRVHLVKKKFKCHMCKMRFLTEPACKKHCLTRHSEIKERKCPYPNCFSKFRSDDTYQDHLGSHKRKKIFKCNFCPSEFTSEKDLNIHLKQTHFAPEKKYVCVSCDRRFDTVDELRTHEAVHKDNPWKCSECSVRFISEIALRAHEDSHKKGTARSRNKLQENEQLDSDVEIISLD